MPPAIDPSTRAEITAAVAALGVTDHPELIARLLDPAEVIGPAGRVQGIARAVSRFRENYPHLFTVDPVPAAGTPPPRRGAPMPRPASGPATAAWTELAERLGRATAPMSRNQCPGRTPVDEPACDGLRGDWIGSLTNQRESSAFEKPASAKRCRTSPPIS